MKHLIRVFAALIAVFAAPAAFAGEPVPGIGVGLEKNPGGIAPPQIVMTDRAGEAAFRRLEAGEYTVFIDLRERTRGLRELIEAGGLRVELELDDTVFSVPVTVCDQDGDRIRLMDFTLDAATATGPKLRAFNDRI